MEENNKVIIFEKKEIVIILIFVIVMIITSFTLGIRLGKKLSDQSPKPLASPVVQEIGQNGQDIELKSDLEEDAETTIQADASLSDEERLKKLMDESQSRLKDELDNFKKDEMPVPQPAPAPTSQVALPTGKFTVQVGSYQTLDEAKQFAEGFTVRGYNPIITNTTITGKGTWYRVSLGSFATKKEAEAYVKQESSLFSGQDYMISVLE